MSISKARGTKVIKASGAVTTTSQSDAFATGDRDDLSIMIDCTARSGTSPSMTVSVQWSNDATTWFTADPAENFTALTDTGSVVKSFVIKGLYARLNYLISGTTPSFTFSAHAITGD